jgi:hypothetical protein
VSDEASSPSAEPRPETAADAEPIRSTIGSHAASDPGAIRAPSKFEPPPADAPLRDPYDTGPRRSTTDREPARPGFAALADPYWSPPGAPMPGGPKPKLSQLAVTSVLTLLLGPVGSIASIVFGWAARREIRRASGAKRGYPVANAGIALGCAFTLAWGAALAFVFVQRARGAGPIADASSSETDTPADPTPDPDPAVPQPRARGPIPALPLPGTIFAPKFTKTSKVGGIEVVDVGASVSSLSEELARQRASGQQAGQKILVMTTAGHCDPCRGVDKSLPDPLVQTALEKTRLLRVDVDVFNEDLQALKMPIKAIPGFFLLSPDLTPKDAINGGEWDEDIPPNIAPVLGAFMRGKYAKRREGWHALPGSGIRL